MVNPETYVAALRRQAEPCAIMHLECIGFSRCWQSSRSALARPSRGPQARRSPSERLAEAISVTQSPCPIKERVTEGCGRGRVRATAAAPWWPPSSVPPARWLPPFRVDIPCAWVTCPARVAGPIRATAAIDPDATRTSCSSRAMRAVSPLPVPAGCVSTALVCPHHPAASLLSTRPATGIWCGRC